MVDMPPCDVPPLQMPTAPDPVLKIVHGLLDCLCAGAAKVGRPLCMCCLQRGDRITPDVCDCDCTEPGPDGKPVNGKGQGWVRVVNQVMVTGPATAGRVRAACRITGRWRTTFEVGIARCIQSVGDEPATCAERNADSHQGIADMWLLRWVVDCCGALKGFEVQGATVAPWGPQGGCAGETIQIVVDIPPTAVQL